MKGTVSGIDLGNRPSRKMAVSQQSTCAAVNPHHA
jgi:hypothetical protein